MSQYVWLSFLLSIEANENLPFISCRRWYSKVNCCIHWFARSLEPWTSTTLSPRGIHPRIIYGNCSSTFNSFSNIRLHAWMASMRPRKYRTRKLPNCCNWTKSMSSLKRQRIAFDWAKRKSMMNRPQMTSITSRSAYSMRKFTEMFWKILRVKSIAWCHRHLRLHLAYRGWMKANTSRSANSTYLNNEKWGNTSAGRIRKQYIVNNWIVMMDWYYCSHLCFKASKWYFLYIIPMFEEIIFFSLNANKYEIILNTHTSALTINLNEYVTVCK